jgi:hypothetical protein
MNIQEITPLIEASLAGLKLDPAQCRNEKPGQWSYRQQKADVWIDVFTFQDNPNKFYLQVMSPLCLVPDNRREEFLLDVLEINYKLVGCWIAKRNDWLYVINLRETLNIDQSEIDATLDRVSYYCNDYLAKLSFKYEGCWIPKPIEGGRGYTFRTPNTCKHIILFNWGDVFVFYIVIAKLQSRKKSAGKI